MTCFFGSFERVSILSIQCSFSNVTKEFSELFKGLGLMDGEISIKLMEGAIPHVEPIRRVPHAMQEPLGK